MEKKNLKTTPYLSRFHRTSHRTFSKELGMKSKQGALLPLGMELLNETHSARGIKRTVKKWLI